jgi:hypothetical protein
MQGARVFGRAFLLACLGLAGSGGVALASPAQIVAADRCCTFVEGPFEQPRGEIANFVNPASAGAIHNVFAVAPGPDGRKLFYSETILPDNESPVAGTEYLATGNYPFVCSIHPGMDGTLSVTGEGESVPRPVVKPGVPGQSRRAVARKGAVKLWIASPTGGSAIALVVRIGKRVVGRAGPLELGRSESRVFMARLNPMGRKIVAAKRPTTIEVTASVRFGSPSTARKVIR